MKILRGVFVAVVLLTAGLFFQGFFSTMQGAFYAQQGDSLYSDKKYEAAFEKYKVAAEKDHPNACYQLYVMYSSGRGVSKNVKNAKSMLEKAVALGDDMAQVTMANHLLSEKTDLQRAIMLLESAAEQENVLAYIDLASAYQHGVGVKKDPAKAIEYARLANAHGANFKLSTTGKAQLVSSEKEITAKIQANLKQLGFYAGGVDGYTGPMTREAISAFQKANNFPVDVDISAELLEQTQKVLKQKS